VVVVVVTEVLLLVVKALAAMVGAEMAHLEM
jgi:hypothetical protein